MRSRQLETALAELFDASASYLREEVTGGAEVGFELGARPARHGAATTLYTYRALTAQFIEERLATISRLPEYVEASRLLAGYDGLERYLASTGAATGRGRTRVQAALIALLDEVFDEQTDFELHPERVDTALERLAQATLASAGEVTVVATLHGVALSSGELQLTKGLRIVHVADLRELPEGIAAESARAEGENQLAIVCMLESDEPAQALAIGREVLGDLLSALRLFGDGRVALGPLAWARVGIGSWGPLALGGAGRPRGMLVITSEQEDELRAFCNLVSRRAPHDNDLAWALRRFELACERGSSWEALTDNLLALRALLEPEGPASGRLAGRLAALCATADERAALTERMTRAIALERSLIAGTADKGAGNRTLVEDVANHLRALLRDVICGHLEADLAVIADELLEPDELLHSDDAPDGELLEEISFEQTMLDGVTQVRAARGGDVAGPSADRPSGEAAGAVGVQDLGEADRAEPGFAEDVDDAASSQQLLPIDGVVSSF
jgi:hypothetical protein